MKQGKRKLQLDRTTIRPLDPRQLTHVAGGTGDQNGSDNDCPYGRGSVLVCDGSCTQNYSNDMKCG